MCRHLEQRLIALEWSICWFGIHEIWVRVKEGGWTIGSWLTGQALTFYFIYKKDINKKIKEEFIRFDEVHLYHEEVSPTILSETVRTMCIGWTSTGWTIKFWLDIVGTVYHLVIYMPSNKIHIVFNGWVYSSHMLARHVSDLTGPSSGAFYKLYLQIVMW